MSHWIFEGYICIPASVIVEAHSMDEAIEKFEEPGIRTKRYLKIHTEERPAKPAFIWEDIEPHRLQP